jgi:DNA-binding FadR family transcriptional regulator
MIWMFKPARPNKISKLIFEEIRNAIFEGKLKPGSKLPSEKELMGVFRVSKAPLREGLRSLEMSGFLEIRKGASGGAFVTEVDMEKARESLFNFLHFKTLSLKHLTEARILVESYIAEKAAPIISEEDLNKLASMMDEFEGKLKRNTPTESFFSQIEFHRTLANATGNPILIFVQDFILNIFLRAKKILKPRKEFYKKALNSHRRIYKALLERDPQKARMAMIRHVGEEKEELCEIQNRQSVI